MEGMSGWEKFALGLAIGAILLTIAGMAMTALGYV